MSRAFTMNEAAETLRVSRRAFQDILKRHPFYYPNGLFLALIYGAVGLIGWGILKLAGML